MTDTTPEPDFPRITPTAWDADEQRGGAAAYTVLAVIGAGLACLVVEFARLVLFTVGR